MHNVGIGTNSPQYNLDVVSDGPSMTAVRSLNSEETESWTINQLAGYGISTDINGIGHINHLAVIDHQQSPIISFLPIPNITGTGTVFNEGIGAGSPSSPLDVLRDEGPCLIRSISPGHNYSSIWTINHDGGFGFGIDESGIGHIVENT